VPDQPFFNESFATYVADALTDHWIIERFGRGSPEEFAWTVGQATQLARTSRLLHGYKLLEALYASSQPADVKLRKKAEIIDELVDDLRMRRRPNNASLTETRVYNGGSAALAVAHRGCGDLRKLVVAGSSLTRKDFQTKLQEDLTSVSAVLVQRCKSAR